MPWQVNSERSLYRDHWVDVRSADIELPNGHHIDHRLIHTAASAGTVVVNEADRVLLVWRHRFITDTWGYEIPLGRINTGEAPDDAAVRVVAAETGWRPGPLTSLLYLQPSPGLTTDQHHVFTTSQVTYVGEPTPSYGTEYIEWVPLRQVPELIRIGQIVSATTIAALLMQLTRRS